MFPMEWLTACVVPSASSDFSETDRQTLIEELGSDFVNLSAEWSSLKDKITPQDEIWEFDTPAEYWASLCGRSGIALVRDANVIATITIEMN
jgi:hypothetical protein